MHCTGTRDLALQRQHQILGRHGDAILAALAMAHQQLAALEFDILDAQAQALEQAHAGAVEQRCDEAHRAVEFVQQRTHFRGRQHDRQAAHVLGGDDLVEPGQFDPQHLAVAEQQRRLGLVLRGRRHRADAPGLDQRGLAGRNRGCAGGTAGGIGIGIHPGRFSPDKPTGEALPIGCWRGNLKEEANR